MVTSAMILLFAPSAHASDNHTTILTATNLQSDGRASATRQLVILLAVTREGCPYCMRLKHEILAPMIKSGEYEEKVLIREMMIEPESDMIDFTGRAVSSGDVAEHYSIEITPTVLLLDHSGRQLHPLMPGINTAEMYGFYLDRAIEQAQTVLKSGEPAGPDQE
jgi:thioredoxin-related protein